MTNDVLYIPLWSDSSNEKRIDLCVGYYVMVVVAERIHVDDSDRSFPRVHHHQYLHLERCFPLFHHTLVHGDTILVGAGRMEPMTAAGRTGYWYACFDGP